MDRKLQVFSAVRIRSRCRGVHKGLHSQMVREWVRRRHNFVLAKPGLAVPSEMFAVGSSLLNQLVAAVSTLLSLAHSARLTCLHCLCR